MSLPHKLTAFALLLVTGTSWLILFLCDSEAANMARTRSVWSCEGTATQLVETLGRDLVQEPDAKDLPHPPTSERSSVLAAMLGIVRRQPGYASLAAVANQDGRLVLVREVRQEPGERPHGTPVELPNAGHRANRTGKPQSAITNEKGRELCTAFVPILDPNEQVLGLLILETELSPRNSLGSTAWASILLSLAVGLLAAALAVRRIGRPMQRMQEQLIAKERITAADVRTPSDLLREVTKSIDRASTDRVLFDARLEQQTQGEQTRIRMKDGMVANTVHELRTPLTSIIASLEIILSHRSDMTEEELMEFISQANIAGKHMMFLVNDLLDSAAVEAGRINMDTERCNLQSLLNDAKRSMEMVAATKSMRLTVPEVNPNIHISADYARVMQVIFNLVSNSVKYSPEGGSVTLRAWANMESVTIEIEDEGEGIPTPMRTKLFTKFSRIHKQNEEPGLQSSGIGLYLSKKLVELMQGTIGYRESELGRGSVFWFTLPLAAVANQPTPLGIGTSDSSE
ncbi:MAG: HAMP domain-containing sensor histidine kinase [Planctomycetota bacterium]|nr:HAMP domain-containing sensor histidine kinase [Planctomycetota bacterium]